MSTEDLILERLAHLEAKLDRVATLEEKLAGFVDSF